MSDCPYPQDGEIWCESMFMDSGAYGLYSKGVHRRTGVDGRELATRVLGMQGKDYSWFNLAKGSEFRAYCDLYAKFIKKMAGRNVLVVNVDVIQNPDLTWEVQRFFEEEHGVSPVPVVHSGEPIKYLDRYLEAGRYDLIGIGGMGFGFSHELYMQWCDSIYKRICPESNGYKPLVRTHGFAMTSWKLICRYPWWSVDSASWVKYSSYGWVLVPRRHPKRGWRFDCPPLRVNMSDMSPLKARKDNHIENVSPQIKEMALDWVKRCNVPMGYMKGEEVVEWGVRSHFVARSRCNLIYFKDLEESRPEWPYPLDDKIIGRDRRGFGL
jgi:hypothetical protein